MVLVAELHRLLRALTFTRDPGRTLLFVSRESDHAKHYDQKDQAGACVLVGTRWKELRHLNRFPVPTEILNTGLRMNTKLYIVRD